MAKKIAIIGNCQSSPLASILRSMADGVEVFAPTPVHRIEESEVSEFLNKLDSFDFIFTQNISSGYRNNIGIDTQNIKNNLKPTQCLFLIPNLYFDGFFPTWGYMKYGEYNLRGKMPINSIPSKLLEGDFSALRNNDYNCFFLLCAWMKGFSVSDTVQLLESRFQSDLIKSWFTESISEFSERERICHTKMTYAIENIKFNNCYDFHSFNHPNRSLLMMLAWQIIDLMGINVVNKEEISKLIIKQKDSLDGIKLPVYRFVAESIGIEDNTRQSLKINSSYFSIEAMTSLYFDYFKILGKEGLSVNSNQKKYQLCERLISRMVN